MALAIIVHESANVAVPLATHGEERATGLTEQNVNKEALLTLPSAATDDLYELLDYANQS